MEIYKNFASKLFNNGFVSIPLDGKIPIPKEWQNWPEDPKEQAERIYSWAKEKPNAGIGLPLGKLNRLVAIDLDMTDNAFLQTCLDRMPAWRLAKQGKKGMTVFYEYNGNRSRKSLRFIHPKTLEERAIEILSDGNQTVIPPSIHPDTKKPYKWNADLSLEDISIDDLDLNFIDGDELINWFEAECLRAGFVDARKAKKLGLEGAVVSGRNNQLKDEVSAMVYKGKPFDAIVKDIMRSDIETYGDNSLFNDPREKLKGKTSLEKAKNFVKNIQLSIEKSGKQIPQQEGPEDTPKMKCTYKAFKEFFDVRLRYAVREKLTGQFMYKEYEGTWQPVLSNLGTLRSFAHSFGLNRAYTEDHLLRYIEDQPKKLLIEPKPWDGKERLIQIFLRLKFKDGGLSPSVCWDLFQDWCANIFRRADNCESQNRILVFRGGQGIGKDTFVENVLGKCLGPYFITMEPRDDNKENFMSIYGKLLCNISEFDQTNSMTLSSLKNLITSSHQTFRTPYERAPKLLNFHCSFFASCNFDSILRDPTGNRRFMIFDVEKIDFSYTELIDHEQILAEMYHWYKTGVRAKKESLDALAKFIEGETPDSMDELIVESVKKMLVSKRGMFNSERLTYDDIKEEISTIARHFGVSVKVVQTVIKRAGLQKKSDGIKYYSASDEIH